VEVSKHTEGFKDKMVRPNGLPESLIRYDGNLIVTFYPRLWQPSFSSHVNCLNNFV